MRTDKHEQVGALAESDGIRVVFHPSRQIAHPGADGYSVDVRESTEIALK